MGDIPHKLGVYMQVKSVILLENQYKKVLLRKNGEDYQLPYVILDGSSSIKDGLIDLLLSLGITDLTLSDIEFYCVDEDQQGEYTLYLVYKAYTKCQKLTNSGYEFISKNSMKKLTDRISNLTESFIFRFFSINPS